jgi:hypothetical protein
MLKLAYNIHLYLNKFGEVDKSNAEKHYSRQNFIYLHHFLDMSKKSAFSAVAKSRKNMVLRVASNVTNVTFVVVNF